jgi:hypothetical protein
VTIATVRLIASMPVFSELTAIVNTQKVNFAKDFEINTKSKFILYEQQRAF